MDVPFCISFFLSFFVLGAVVDKLDLGADSVMTLRHRRNKIGSWRWQIRKKFECYKLGWRKNGAGCFQHQHDDLSISWFCAYCYFGQVFITLNL